MPTQTSHSHIKGWGADLDKKKRPAVPKEKKPPGNAAGAHWTIPDKQIPKHKIFKSIEHPQLPPVLGTSVAPYGLSGLIRSFAYKFSEGKMQHWMLLLFADRINVVEGIFQDLAKGHIPNIPAEMGIKSELKYNKQGAVKKLLIAGSLISVGILFFQSRNQSKARL